jgi:hypothetical protein
MSGSRKRPKLDVPFTNDEEVADMVEQFEQCRWPNERWTHRAHLAVAVSYLRRLPYAAALERVRHHIRLYNRTCGDGDGYHETITVLFMRKVDGLLKEVGGGASAVEVVEELSRSCDMSWLLRYYTEEWLWSAEARCGWVEPDVRPLDF